LNGSLNTKKGYSINVNDKNNKKVHTCLIIRAVLPIYADIFKWTSIYVHTHTHTQREREREFLKLVLCWSLSCGFPQNVSCSFFPNRSSWIFTDPRLVTLKDLCVESHEVVILGRVHF